MQVSCMIYYPEKSWLVCAPSTTRPLSTGVTSSNLRLKQLPMVLSFLSGRKCCENIIDHQAYLWYLRKPVGEMNYVWGDNESMINSSNLPEAKLHKRHNILSFNYVRSMISRVYINLQHLASQWNFADILTRNWSYQSSYYELIQPVFHHSGNTAAAFLDDTLE